MSNIFCIIGKSGTGKDTIYHEIMSLGIPGLVPVIPYTTRPIRSNEINGVNYFFVSEKQLEEYESAGKVIEKRTYMTVHGPWSYFNLHQELEEDKDYILIATPEALQAFIEKYGRETIRIIYLKLDDKERLLRCINRESEQKTPNYSEVCRRYLADEQDFSEEKLGELSEYYTIDTGNTPDRCLEEWKKIYAVCKDLNR